jgi:transglutaminase-like putative cysteine protease
MPSMLNCSLGQAFPVSRKNAIIMALALALMIAPFVPWVQAQNQYMVNDISCTVTALDDRSARVVMDCNFTWLEASTYVSTWNLVLDSQDAHGIQVESQGRTLSFNAYSTGDATNIVIDLGRNVGTGQWMVLKVEYVTSSNIESIGPERRLSMSIWENAPIDRVNLTVMIPEGFGFVSYKPSFLEEPDWGNSRVLTGVGGGAPRGTSYYLFASYAEVGAEYNMTYEYTFTNIGALTEYGAEFEVPVFAEAPHQNVTQLTISPEPLRSWYDDSGNLRARFKFDTILPGESAKMVIRYNIRISIPTMPDSTFGGSLEDVPLEFRAYTKGDEYWEVGDPSIAGLALDLTEGRSSVLEMAESIFDLVAQNISYDYVKYNAVMSGITVERYGAAETLELGRGVCEDITDLYIALCRAAGIPAVEVVGFTYNDDGMLSQANRHAWAEVYIPDYGWMDVDPTWELFGRLEGRHVGDRMFINSSEPSYLVWSTRQNFEYRVDSFASIRGEGVYYQPDLHLSTSHGSEAYTGTVFPVRLTISNGGNGTAFNLQGNVTWSDNVEVQNGSISIDRIWSYDYQNIELIVEPKEPGNATLGVHLVYTGEGNGEAEEDYSFTFVVTEKPVYSIEGLVASLNPYVWYTMGGVIVIAVLASLAVWATRRPKNG